METFFDSRHYLSESAQPGHEIMQLLGSLEYSTFGVIIDGNLPITSSSNSQFEGAAFVERVYATEQSKTVSTVLGLISEHQNQLDKNSLICVIGGGALLDLAGLCCGLMYRGVRYVSVPTTVIAMADAAYGGKTAVNLGARNQIGMYHHPQLVYVNPVFLQSLPDLHVRSGIIEIAKLAIFFPDIRTMLDEVSAGRAHLMEAVRLAATRKLELLADDPFEERRASVLLYGHPFGNAFEVYARERNGEHVPHGFAVAIGMLFSSWLAERLHPEMGRPADDLQFLSTWIDVAALIPSITPPRAAEMTSLLLRDKYASNDTLRVPALHGREGYTAVPLKRIGEEYDAWRASLVANRHEAVEPHKTITRGAPSYIAGKPSDETVAPLHFSHADGPYLVASDGRRILDWSTCLNAPFGHSCRIDTSTLPVNAGNYPTDQRDLLVKELQRLFPNMSGFQFRSSGTEAVEAALRYVCAALGPATQTVALEGCYHGLTLGARNVMGTSDSNTHRTELPFRATLDPAAALDTIESLLRDRPVAVWLEGVQGATLRRLPAEFLRGLRTLRERHEGQLAVIADDMLASIRCGDWCSLSPSLEPDLIIGGKSWANGYPFSFFGTAPWIRALGGDILGTTTYGGNPIACANAVYTIARVIGTAILPSLRAKESSRAAMLKEIFTRKETVLRTEWHGLLFGIELSDVAIAAETARRAANAGVLVSQLGVVIRCSPPLDLPDRLLGEGLAVLAKAVPDA